MMVDTTLPGDRRAAGTEFHVERLVDREAIRALLAPEGAYAAYALAQLSPSLMEQSEWWSANGLTGARPGGGAGRGLVVHSRGGLGRAMVTIGEPTAVESVLRLHPGPRFCFASFRLEHREAIQRHFMLTRNELMVRMSVRRETFKPVEGKTVRMTGRDVSSINRLYMTEGGPASYTSRHIDHGVYCGVIAFDKLVSIAGTHVNSPEERVAVVGNVFTHPRYRGTGLATIATSAVTSILLEHCDQVALTVEATNASALAVYDRLGYGQVCTLYETPAVRKDALGVFSAIRRWAAGWRGRRQGKEIVIR